MPDFEQILAKCIIAMKADPLKAAQDAVVEAGWLERWEIDEGDDWDFVAFVEDAVLKP